ncbi:hypothetical protein NLG97_g3076 [Lecanicillium saksenae]|uniref:Uncharacterized protein n=1 Tax=Lecanicillium saksenae TaxID=468837 RepID=A0ACC1QZB4_9HYPO|nr:hypothetical protein NLG97_g3076 [Lecanicillium saksenae]
MAEIKREYRAEVANQPNRTDKFSLTSRPKSTGELIRRLGDLHVPYFSIERIEKKSLSTVKTEADALCAWTRCMLDTFIREKDPEYAADAALLSPFTDKKYYEILIREFVNMICDGVSDQKLPNTELLATFSTVFRYPDPHHSAHGDALSYAMSGLVTRFQAAKSTGSGSIQYKLIVGLSDVLDAMNDAKVKGISDAKTVQPLLDMLAEAAETKELRISEAAKYAYQSLLGIPSDTSPWTKFWKHAFKSVEGLAKVAGSVYSADPSKFLEGVQSVTEIFELVKFLIETVQKLSEATDSFGDAGAALKNVRRPAPWYFALKYTSMLLRENSPTILENFLHKAPWCQEDNFLCGLCAQLDRLGATKTIKMDGAIATDHEEGANNGARAVLETFLRKQGQESDSTRLRTWLSLIRLPPDDTARQVSRKAKFKKVFAKFCHASHEYETHSFGEIEVREPNDRLLKDAWNGYNDGRVFYADQAIRQHYTNKDNDLLKIERLKGDELHVDQFYVKLNIQRESSGENIDNKIGKKRPEALPLEDLMVMKPGSPDARMRILVHGQAGVGKSTICKKIVYNFIYRGMWATDIDRVIWVRLRDLGGTKTDTVKGLLQRTFFYDEPLLVDSLYEAISEDRTKTLFILDGLDEVPTGEDLGSGLCSKLLEWPRTIVTTRTYRKNVQKIPGFGLFVEIHGFDFEQVKQYVKTVSPDNSTEIQRLIDNHPAIQGFASIPIQLDAICLSREMKSLDPPDLPESLTGLYRDVTRALWRKDVVSLGKCHQGNGKPITAEEARNLPYPDVTDLVQDELNLLQAFAFTGLYSNTKTFHSKNQEQLWKLRGTLLQLMPASAHTTMLADFSKLSFLRAFNDRSDRHFELLHDTIQDYLAAQFFVQHWILDKPVPCLRLGQGIEQMLPESFLARKKYNHRYELFWRFVSGLLQSEGGGEDLCRFFQKLDMQPLDLLGLVHQRLVMHCLSEVLQDVPFRIQKEQQLQWWLRFGCTSNKYTLLSKEVEFPEAALFEVFENARDHEVMSINVSRWGQPMPSKLRNIFSFWLRGNLEPHFRENLLLALENSRGAMESKAIKQAANQLTTESTADIEALQTASNDYEPEHSLSDDDVLEMLKAMDAAVLNDKDVDARDVELVRGQLRWSKEITEAIMTRLNHPRLEIPKNALAVLDGQLPVQVTEAIVKLLDDFPDAWLILLEQDRLADNVQMAILERLDNRDLRKAMGFAINEDGPAVETFVSFIQELLEDESAFTEEDRKTLMKQCRLTDENFTMLIRQLLHRDKRIRTATRSFLMKQSQSLKKIGIHKITDRLGSNDLDETESVLANQLALSDEVLLGLVKRLDNIDSATLDAAKYILHFNMPYSEVLNTEIIQRLHSRDADVRLNALGVVGSDLSDDMARLVVQMLDDAERSIRRAAVGVLMEQSLPDECVAKLTAKLDDPNPDTRQDAWDVLLTLGKFPEATILNLIQRLHCPDRQLDAWSILNGQRHLPDEVLPFIIQILNGDAGSKMRRRVVQNLDGHSEVYKFSDKLLVSITEILGTICLNHEQEPVVEVKGQYIPLTDSAMKTLYDLFMTRAMRDKWNWYVLDGKSVLNHSEVTSTSIQNPEVFTEFIVKRRPAKFPPVIGITPF